jgi:sarcosine oxidase gamma subunit
VKGRDAAAALAAAGVEPPVAPNRWRRHAGLWCLRLGAGEYLLAHDEDAAGVDAVVANVASRGGACHVLLRSDRCIALSGPRATERLLQTCDIDERRFARTPDALALVMLADVSVTLHADGPGAYRIWCDPTFIPHLVETFAALDARSTSTRLSHEA